MLVQPFFNKATWIAGIFFIQSAWASSDCLNDFRTQQKYARHNLPAESIALLDAKIKKGDPIEGWNLIGDWGDDYAKLAHEVVSSSSDFLNQFYRKLIRAHWHNSVGQEKLKKNFDLVARQHFRQYASLLQTGYWPDSDQILMSYLLAVKTYGLPEVTVFDAAWVQSGYQHIVSWQTLNHLKIERTVTHSRICLETDASIAREIINQDFMSVPIPNENWNSWILPGTYGPWSPEWQVWQEKIMQPVN